LSSVNITNSGDQPKHSKPRRGSNLPRHVTAILPTWLSEHMDDPYPTEREKQMLMGWTNLTISQVGPSDLGIFDMAVIPLARLYV
ncbi:homeodomain superfamily, partial [Exophiala xenobiotica]